MEGIFFIMRLCTGINFHGFANVINNSWSQFAINNIFALLYLMLNNLITQIYKVVCTVMTNLIAKGIFSQAGEVFSSLASITAENLEQLIMSILSIFSVPLYEMTVTDILARLKDQLHITQTYLWSNLYGFLGALNPLNLLRYKPGNTENYTYTPRDISLLGEPDSPAVLKQIEALQIFSDSVSQTGYDELVPLIESAKTLIFSLDKTTKTLALNANSASHVLNELGGHFKKTVYKQATEVLDTTWNGLFSNNANPAIDAYYQYALDVYSKNYSSTTVQDLYQYIYGKGMALDFNHEYIILVLEWYILHSIFWMLIYLSTVV